MILADSSISFEFYSMHCITYVLKRKKGKTLLLLLLLFKQTLRARFKCVACRLPYRIRLITFQFLRQKNH